jgi:hypothetical protein
LPAKIGPDADDDHPVTPLRHPPFLGADDEIRRLRSFLQAGSSVFDARIARSLVVMSLTVPSEDRSSISISKTRRLSTVEESMPLTFSITKAAGRSLSSTRMYSRNR